MRHPRGVAVLLVTLALPALAACGGDGEAGGGGRTVDIEMTDIAYSVKRLDVERGQTVRFVFRNEGVLDHEAFVGDRAAQRAHEDEMAGMTDDTTGKPEGEEHSHGDATEPGGITVAPGKTGRLTHTFADAGSFEIACHQPGHYDAGMKIAVRVR